MLDAREGSASAEREGAVRERACVARGSTGTSGSLAAEGAARERLDCELSKLCDLSIRQRTSSSLLLPVRSISVVKFDDPRPPLLLSVLPSRSNGEPEPEFGDGNDEGRGENAVVRDSVKLTGRFLGVGSLRVRADQHAQRGIEWRECDALDEDSVPLYHVVRQTPRRLFDVFVVRAAGDDLLLLFLSQD